MVDVSEQKNFTINEGVLSMIKMLIRKGKRRMDMWSVRSTPPSLPLTRGRCGGVHSGREGDVQKRDHNVLLLNITIPSGGTVIERECPFPCMGAGVD